MHLSVEVFETLESLKSLEHQWKSLEQCASSKYYQTYAYNFAYYSILQCSEIKPYIIAFKFADNLVAVFPWEKRCHQKLGLRYCEVGSISHDHVNFTDILVENHQQVNVANAFSEFLDSLPWNTLLTSCGVLESAGLVNVLKKVKKITLLKKCISKSFYLNFCDSDIDADLPKKMLKNGWSQCFNQECLTTFPSTIKSTSSAMLVLKSAILSR